MTAANDARLFADDAHRYDGAKFPTPRPFQESAHQALRQGFKEGHRRQLIAAPTGAGKSILALRIIHEALLKGKRAVFLADRNTLIAQTSAAAVAVGLREHGIIRISRSIQSLPASLVCSNSRLDPVEVGQLAQALWILAQAYPGIAQRLIEFLQISIDPIAQVALAQLAPQQFGRVELGRIRRQV